MSDKQKFYPELTSKMNFSEMEENILKIWDNERIFEAVKDARKNGDEFVFYDGPPFANGQPHYGHIFVSYIKDTVARFQTMLGKKVERPYGWDCHGLPAENFVEKQLGITDRREIGTKWSLEEYITKARESMVANSETWRATID